jgi:hypothetical protein
MRHATISHIEAITATPAVDEGCIKKSTWGPLALCLSTRTEEKESQLEHQTSARCMPPTARRDVDVSTGMRPFGLMAALVQIFQTM